MIPPDGLAPGRSSLAPRASRCSGIRQHTPVVSAASQACGTPGSDAPPIPRLRTRTAAESPTTPQILHCDLTCSALRVPSPGKCVGRSLEGSGGAAPHRASSRRPAPGARGRGGGGDGVSERCFHFGPGRVKSRLPFPARVSWSQRNPQCSGASLTGGIPERT